MERYFIKERPNINHLREECLRKLELVIGSIMCLQISGIKLIKPSRDIICIQDENDNFMATITNDKFHDRYHIHINAMNYKDVKSEYSWLLPLADFAHKENCFTISYKNSIDKFK